VIKSAKMLLITLTPWLQLSRLLL